jgi:proteasome accessory factor C
MREVEFRYLATGTTKGECRRVRPYAVSLHRGQWYLSGYCCTRDDDRLFRVDRISELEVTATGFRSRKGPFPVERTAGAGEAARLLFSRGSAPWVRERFGEDVKVRPDGTLEVAIASATPEWMVPYVLSFGGEAQVLGPPALRRAVREAAKKALARY